MYNYSNKWKGVFHFEEHDHKDLIFLGLDAMGIRNKFQKKNIKQNIRENFAPI